MSAAYSASACRASAEERRCQGFSLMQRPGACAASPSLRSDERLHAEPGCDLRDEVVAGGGERARAAGGVRRTGRRARHERALADHLAALEQGGAGGDRAVAFRLTVEDLRALLQLYLQHPRAPP